MKERKLCSVSIICYILNIQDNPGNEEKQQKIFFVGDSGQQLNKFYTNFLGVNENEVLLINKSFFHSESTSELELISAVESFNANQQDIAEYILNLVSRNQEAFVCLLGVDYFEYSKVKEQYFGLFSTFYNTLLSKVPPKKVGLYYHPSRRYPITISQQKTIQENGITGVEEKRSIFRQLGIKELEHRRDKKPDFLSEIVNNMALAKKDN